MTKPLALLLHEKLMPGSQALEKQFEELDYRVVVISDPAQLADQVRVEMPMIVVADLVNRRGDVLAAIAAMAGHADTAHVPVIAYLAREDEKRAKRR